MTHPAHVPKSPHSCTILYELYLRHTELRENCFDSSEQLRCPKTGWFRLARDEVKRVKAVLSTAAGDKPGSAKADLESQHAMKSAAKDIDNLLAENVQSWGVLNVVKGLVQNDNLQTIKRFLSNGLVAESQLAHVQLVKTAFAHGSTEVLGWMHSKWPGSVATQENLNVAVANGQVGIVKWMANIAKHIVPSQDAVNQAARILDIEALQRWCQAWNVFPDQRGANKAAENGRLEALKWLASFDLPILPDQEGTNRAARNGHLKVLEWLTSLDPPILPDPRGANGASQNARLKVLKWLASLHPPILPEQWWGADGAAGNGHLEVLEWLASLDPPILPGREGANWAAENRQLEVLKWLASLHPPILPD
jgi:hypothetical protein